MDPTAHIPAHASYEPAAHGSSALGAAAVAILGSSASGAASLDVSVDSRKAAWRARISAMTRGTVQVLDVGRLIHYDEMQASLAFQLATLGSLLDGGRLWHMLRPSPSRASSIWRRRTTRFAVPA